MRLQAAGQVRKTRHFAAGSDAFAAQFRACRQCRIPSRDKSGQLFLFPDFFRGAVFNVSYFIKYPPFCKREGTIQEVLVKQANDVCIEPVKAPDLFDYFLFTIHNGMILKSLDKVKQFDGLKIEIQ